MYEQFSNTVIEELEYIFNELPLDKHGEKFLLSAYNSSALDEIFNKIIESCNDTVEIYLNNDKKFTFRAWTIEGRTVIPCRVNPTHEELLSLEPNVCTREFNGKLRDFFYFNSGQIVENRVLLTLDDSPIETQKASNPLPQLNPKNLLQRTINRYFPSEDTARNFLNILDRWVKESGALDANDVDVFLNLLRNSLSMSDPLRNFVQNISSLGFLNLRGEELDFLKDSKLKENLKLKNELKSLLSPERIFEQEIAMRFEEEFAEKIVTSHRKNEDFLKKFFYEDFLKFLIPKNKKKKFTITDVLLAGKKPIESKDEENQNDYLFKISPGEKLTNLRFVFNKIPEGVSFFITHQNTYSKIHFPIETFINIENAYLDITFNATALGYGEYCFFSIEVKEGNTRRSRNLKVLNFAVVKAEAEQKIFYEKHLSIDLENQAFRLKSNASIYTVLESDEIDSRYITLDIKEEVDLEGPCTIDLNSSELLDELNPAFMMQLNMSWDGYTTKIPILLEYEFQKEEDIATIKISNLYEFLLNKKLEMKNGENEENWTLSPYKVTEDNIIYNGLEYGFDNNLKQLIQVEKKIRKYPETLTWHVTGNIFDPAANFSANKVEEQLPNWRDFPAFNHYIKSRRDFFEIIENSGKVSIPFCFIADNSQLLDAARSYVNSYLDLCEAISNYDESTSEVYERGLYTDILTTENNELFILPTHPLFIQYIIMLGDQVKEWLETEKENFIFGKKDIRSLSPAFYIPFLQFKNEWYELLDSEYLCWSRYQRSNRSEGEGLVPEYVSSIIYSKIMQFKQTHPVLFYKGKSSKLLINVINPGNAKYLSDSLLNYFKSNDSPHEIHLNLIGQGPIGAYLDYIFTCDEPPVGVNINDLSKMREYVSYTKSNNTSNIPYAHLTFLINLYHAKLDRELKIDSFPASIFVNGLLPKTTRKLTSSGDNSETYTYAQALWTGGACENREEYTLRTLSTYLQEHFRSMKKILNKNVGMVKSVTINPSMLKEELYNNSRWVIHLDREIGLEIFSKNLNDQSERPIILEYSKQYNPYKDGFDVITTTSQLEPYKQRVRDILNLSTDSQAAEAVRILNSLSGSWALKLMQNNTNDISDRTSNVIAYKYLILIEKALQPINNSVSVIVSLEEFLRVTGKIGLPTSEGWNNNLGNQGEYSDDLLLLTIHKPVNDNPLKIDARIIEVKFGSSNLKKGYEQVKKTHAFFTERFGNSKLTDHLFRSMDFANLILDGIEKAILFNHLSQKDLIDLDFENKIYNRLINGDFKLYLDGEYQGSRFLGDVLHINPDSTSSFSIQNKEVRLITIPKSYFIPLLEDDFSNLASMISTFTLFKKETTHGLFHEVSETETENEPDLETDTEPETETENEPDLETDTEPETETETEPGLETDTEPETETENEPDLETDTEPETETETEPDLETDTEIQSKNEFKPESEIATSEVKLFLGNILGTSQPVFWDHRREIENPLVNHNLTITGDPGKGKTQTVKSIIHGLRKYNLPTLLLDFKDDYIDPEFLKREKLELIDIIREGLPFNPLEPHVKGIDNDFIAIEEILKVEQLLKRIFKLGDQQSNQLRKAMIEAFSRKGINTQTLTNINSVKVFPTLSDVHKILIEEEKKHETLLSRLSLLFQLNLFDKKEGNKITFSQLMNGSYTIRLTRLPGNELKSAVAELLILAIHNYLLSGNQPRRLTRCLVLDEAHRVSQSNALLEMMREGRAFGIGVVISTQFPTDIRSEIYGCTETKIFLGNDQLEHSEAGATQLVGSSSKNDIRIVSEQIRSLGTHQGFLRNFHYPKVLLEFTPYYKRIETI